MRINRRIDLHRCLITTMQILFCALPLQAAHAAGADNVDQQIDQINQVSNDHGYGFRNGSVVVAPVPFSNPTIGTGLALGAGYLFKTDRESKTSVIGLGAMRSDNGSQAIGLIANLAFNKNKWLFNSFVGKADVRYDLFTSLGPLPVHQDGVLGRFNLAYGVTQDLSFGGVVRYANTAIGSGDPSLPALPPPYDLDLDLEIVTLGFTADWDRRNDTDYPTNGTRLTAEATRGFVIAGLGRSYDKAFAIFDAYKSLNHAASFALRGVICGASSETPFFDQCSIGGTDNMRGFSSTQFLDLRSSSIQGEYRQRLSPRWGAVMFAGIGWSAAQFDQLQRGGSHSAIGVGARYRVSKKFPVDFSVDLSRNNLGDDLIYIYVGQRF